MGPVQKNDFYGTGPSNFVLQILKLFILVGPVLSKIFLELKLIIILLGPVTPASKIKKKKFHIYSTFQSILVTLFFWVKQK
jgi:hypothetical protein